MKRKQVKFQEKTIIMCSEVPTYDSYRLASSISNLSENTKLSYFVAGITYDGAVEDTLNLNGTPTVTPSVLVPSHGKVHESTVKESFAQMLSLLLANRNIDPNDDYLNWLMQILMVLININYLLLFLTLNI